MGIATAAEALYALVVFLIGFIFGTIRVLLLAPRLGATGAVVLDTPIMLAASWFVCRWCAGRLNVSRTIPTRSVMGAVASVVLMVAEISLAVFVFGRSATESITAYESVPGAIGLAGQSGFACFRSSGFGEDSPTREASEPILAEAPQGKKSEGLHG